MSVSTKELFTAFFKGLAFAKGLNFGDKNRGMAQDDDKWITIHPNGTDNRAVMIDDKTGVIKKGLAIGLIGTKLKDIRDNFKDKAKIEQHKARAEGEKAPEPVKDPEFEKYVDSLKNTKIKGFFGGVKKVYNSILKDIEERGITTMEGVNQLLKEKYPGQLPAEKKEPEILKRNYAEEIDRINDIVKKLNEQDYKKAEESDLAKNYPALAENLKNERDRSYLTAVINNTGLTNKADFIKYLKEFNAGVLERLQSTENTLLYKQREKQISKTEEGGAKETGTKESSSGKVGDLDKYMKGWNRKIYKYRDGTKAIFSNNQKIVLTEEQYNYLKDKAAN